jgi:hypothetical protein
VLEAVVAERADLADHVERGRAQERLNTCKCKTHEHKNHNGAREETLQKKGN